VDLSGTGGASGDWPLVHVVQSRFMQEQGPLETLGTARLKLFLAFCLPSMTGQSSQNFLWIVRTDPGLAGTPVFDGLVRSVRQHENIYVVASNKNFVFGSAGLEGSWRDGTEPLDLLASKIYTGNTEKLHAAIALRNERPVLETRLDADDGLHANYIEHIQKVALERFRRRPLPENENDRGTGGTNDASVVVPNWLYWCSRRHIEWHSDADASLSETERETMGSPDIGYMNVVQHDKLCVTPGTTIGYNVVASGGGGVGTGGGGVGTGGGGDHQTKVVDVPLYDHDKLYKNVHGSDACYDKSDGDGDTNTNTNDAKTETTKRGPCLELVEEFLFCAIRSRTWTSAGMQNINLASKDVPRGGSGSNNNNNNNKSNEKRKELTEKLWALSEQAFGVTKQRARETQDFLTRHKKEIARENLMGQCSTGHSCKDKAKEELQRIVTGTEK